MHSAFGETTIAAQQSIKVSSIQTHPSQPESSAICHGSHLEPSNEVIQCYAMDKRREEVQPTIPASPYNKPVTAQRTNDNLKEDRIDINSVEHNWVRTFLQTLDEAPPASLLPAIEDIVMWIAEGDLRVATQVYRSTRILQIEFDKSSTRTVASETAGKGFYRALKCLRLARGDYQKAKGMLKSLGQAQNDGVVNHHYLLLDRLYFKTKYGVDPCEPVTTQISQEMQAVIEDSDAVILAKATASDRRLKSAETGEAAAKSPP